MNTHPTISSHAVQRYRQRVARKGSKRSARRQLKRLVESAKEVGPGVSGAVILEAEDLRFVVRGGAVLTVYPKDEEEA